MKGILNTELKEKIPTEEAHERMCFFFFFFKEYIFLRGMDEQWGTKN